MTAKSFAFVIGLLLGLSVFLPSEAQANACDRNPALCDGK